MQYDVPHFNTFYFFPVMAYISSMKGLNEEGKIRLDLCVCEERMKGSCGEEIVAWRRARANQ
jgi:hypothetical protein